MGLVMIQGLLSGVLLFSILAYSLSSGVDFYASAEGRHGPVIFYIASLSVLFGGVFIYTYRYFIAWRAKRWPYVVGIVEDARCIGDRWEIHYKYRVNDTPYYGSTYSLERSQATRAEVATKITQTSDPVADDVNGRRVRVYYNPEEASTCVLSRDGQPSVWALTIPATVSVSGSCLLLFIMLSGLGAGA
jgi:hypothetical protein